MNSADLVESRGGAGWTGAGQRRVTVALIYLVLGAVVLAPVFVVRVPCLGDYLNHLARIHIESAIAESAALQRYYEPHLQWVPYFGMDAPVLLLAPLLGLYQAGLLFAAWIAAARWRRWQRAAVFVPAALLLYLAHVFAFGGYGILIAGYELGQAARRGLPGWRASMAGIATAGAQAVPPVLLAWWLHVDGGFGAVQVTRYGSIQEKIAALLSPVVFPGHDLAMTVLVLMMATGAGTLAWWLATRRARVAPDCIAPLIAIALAAVAMPHVLFNVWGADFRFPLVAVIVLIGGLAPGPRLGRKAAGGVAAALVVVVVLAAVNAGATLLALDGQVTAVRAIVARLPEGVRLLVVDGPDAAPRRVAPDVMTGHIGLVAAIDRNAFVPFLFTGATALRVQPGLRDTASPNAEAVTLPQLREGYSNVAPSGPLPVFGYGGTKYWMGWKDKFDYVLITHFGAPTGGLPGCLQKVADGPIAGLYRVAAPQAE